MKEIPGFPGYFADETGVIYTTKRKGGNNRDAGQRGPARPMSVSHDARGYCRVTMDVEGRIQTRLVHRLVLETFVGPCGAGMDGCHHPDPCKNNNRLDNLRWDTHRENILDKTRSLTGATEKTCRRCGLTKPMSDFYVDRRATDGRHGECKPCHCKTAIESRDLDKKRAANLRYMRRVRSAARG